MQVTSNKVTVIELPSIVDNAKVWSTTDVVNMRRTAHNSLADKSAASGQQFRSSPWLVMTTWLVSACALRQLVATLTAHGRAG